MVLATNGSWHDQRLYSYTWALSRLIELMNKENMPRELCATNIGLRWRAIGVTPPLTGLLTADSAWPTHSGFPWHRYSQNERRTLITVCQFERGSDASGARIAYKRTHTRA
jgi:hypothetical protein